MQDRLTFYQASCIEISPERRLIACETVVESSRFELEYDILVVAVGATTNTFGLPGVDELALRQRIIACLESASVSELNEEPSAQPSDDEAPVENGIRQNRPWQ